MPSPKVLRAWEPVGGLPARTEQEMHATYVRFGVNLGIIAVWLTTSDLPPTSDMPLHCAN